MRTAAGRRTMEGVVPPELDLIYGLLGYRIWLAFAWHDIKQRYRRSKLGPFWFVLNNFIFIAGLGLLYAQIFDQDVSFYLPYLSGGFIVWQFISSCITEGANCLVENQNVIKQVNVPLSTHAFRVATRNILILMHSVPLMILFPLYFGRNVGFEIAILPLVFAIYFVNSVALNVIFGLLGARFRDVQPITQNLVTIGFFLTPIMWLETQLSERAALVQFNPLYHFIVLARDPLMGSLPPFNSVIVVGLFSVFAIVIAWLSLRAKRDHAAYWL